MNPFLAHNPSGKHPCPCSQLKLMGLPAWLCHPAVSTTTLESWLALIMPHILAPGFAFVELSAWLILPVVPRCLVPLLPFKTLLECHLFSAMAGSEGAALAVGDLESQKVWCGSWLLRPWRRQSLAQRLQALERRGQATLEAKQLSFVLFVFPSRSQCFRGHNKWEVMTVGHSGLRIWTWEAVHSSPLPPLSGV